MKMGKWEITVGYISYTNFSGGERKAGVKVLLPEAVAIADGNASFSADAPTKTLNGLTNTYRNSPEKSFLGTTDREEANETYKRVTDYLKEVKVLSSGSVTDCQVCASRVDSIFFL